MSVCLLFGSELHVVFSIALFFQVIHLLFNLYNNNEFYRKTKGEYLVKRKFGIF